MVGDDFVPVGSAATRRYDTGNDIGDAYSPVPTREEERLGSTALHARAFISWTCWSSAAVYGNICFAFPYNLTGIAVRDDLRPRSAPFPRPVPVHCLSVWLVGCLVFCFVCFSRAGIALATTRGTQERHAPMNAG